MDGRRTFFADHLLQKLEILDRFYKIEFKISGEDSQIKLAMEMN